MVGIVCGTYSSVCITGALWYVMTTGKQKKEQAAALQAAAEKKATKEAKRSGKKEK